MTIKNALHSRTQSPSLSLTNLIQWGDHFSVNHSGIDGQHKKIFDLGFTVYKNWLDGEGVDVLHPIVIDLADLLKAHFVYEERILVEIGYEDLNEHAVEHRSMLKDMETMRKKMNKRLQLVKEGRTFSRGSMLAPGWPVVQFILGFTVGHVSTSDMGYCKALTAGRDPGAGVT